MRLIAVLLFACSLANAGDRVLLVGDSIIVHMALDVSLPADVMVFAVGGARVTEGAQYAVPSAITFLSGPGGEPMLSRVVVLLGVNDWKRQALIPRFRSAYRQMIAGSPVPVTCILPLPAQDERSLPRPLRWYRDAISEACSDVRDPREVIPEWSADMYTDEVHPNARGSAILAAWLLG